MLKAYRYQLDPNATQRQFFARAFGSARYIYNWSLEKRIKAYQEEKKRLTAYDLCKLLTPLKNEEGKEWLYETPNVCLQQAIRNMDSAFVRFFREKNGFPKFRSKHGKQRIQFINYVEVDFVASKIKLPKIGWVRIHNPRSFEGRMGTVTVSRNAAGKYFVSVLVHTPNPIPEKRPLKEDTTVGVHLPDKLPSKAARTFLSTGSSITNAGGSNAQTINSLLTRRPFFNDASGVLVELEYFLSTGNAGRLMELKYMLGTNVFAFAGFGYLGSCFSRVLLSKEGICLSNSGLGKLRHSQDLMWGAFSPTSTSAGDGANVIAELVFSGIENANPMRFSFIKLVGVVHSLDNGNVESIPSISGNRSVQWYCSSEVAQPLVLSEPLEYVHGLPYVTLAIDGVPEKVDARMVKRSLTVSSHATNIGGLKDFARDVGLKDFAVMSDGTREANPRHFQNSEKRLACLQRRLSRKVKGSNRRKRAKLAVAKCHYRIACQRNDFLHKLTSRLVKNHDSIVIEDLNVGGMLKNHCLAKHISSASWSEFFRQLEYKCEWGGKNLIRIGRFEPSSRLCTCGFVNRELTLKDRTWNCPSCGEVHDRDLLAARNIKMFGLEKTNLIGQVSGAVSAAEDVEAPALAGPVKRQVNTTRQYDITQTTTMDKIKQARNKAIEAHASITMGEHTIAHVLLGDVVNLLSELEGSKPKEPPRYVMSRDYDALHELLCKGGEALGYSRKEGYERRAVQFFTRNGRIRWGTEASYDIIEQRSAFLGYCAEINLEWIAVEPPKEQGAEPVAWMTMDTCPTDRRVLLMHPDVTGEMRCCCWRTGDGFEPEDIGALGWAEFGRTTRTPAAPTAREKAMEEAGDAMDELLDGPWFVYDENREKAISVWRAAKSTK